MRDGPVTSKSSTRTLAGENIHNDTVIAGITEDGSRNM